MQKKVITFFQSICMTLYLYTFIDWNRSWSPIPDVTFFMNWIVNPEENSCNFLDLKISISENKIRTDLYRKDTDKPRALLPSSAHPNHIPNNIIYSMAFRLLRICDTEDLFEMRLNELKNEFLIPRNYKTDWFTIW